MNETINVVIVDDDPFIQESLSIILGLDAELSIAATCGNGLEAYEFIQRSGSPVDIVLMDIRMPGCDGVEGTKLIKEHSPHTAIIILTTFKDDEYIVQALQHGASGYLLKNIPPAQIIDSIKMVQKGSMLIHPEVAGKISGLLKPAEPGRKALAAIQQYSLTETELSIIHKISEGLSNKEISQSLFLSEGTVKNYVSDLLRKLSLRDRTQVAIFYFTQLKD